MKETEKGIRKDICPICRNLGFVFDRKTNTAKTCIKCLKEGRLNQDNVGGDTK